MPVDPGLLVAPRVGEGIQYRMTARIGPGEESEKCKFVQVGDRPLFVRKNEPLYTAGSHHMLLYTTPYTEIPTARSDGTPLQYEGTDGVFDCTRGASAGLELLAVVGGAQNPRNGGYEFPEGIALEIPARSVLLLNVHYINASDLSLDAGVYLNLWTAPPEEVHTRAGVIFFYNPYIHVPGSGTARARYVCPVGRDITLLTAQSHMHARGVGFTASVLDASGRLVGTAPIYRETSWDDPRLQSFGDSGVPLAAGSAIDYECEYRNDDGRERFQGPSADDEMCMFIAAYHPRDAALEACAPEGSDPVASRYSAGVPVGSGTRPCGDSLASILAEGYGRTMMRTVTSTCPAHARPLYAAYRCAGAARAACAPACASGAGDCLSCIETRCTDEFATCRALTSCP
jgi:hypothetical protein